MDSMENINKIDKKIIYSIIISLGVLLLVSTYYIFYQGGNGIFNNDLFWLSIILIGFGTLLIAADTGIDKNYKIWILFLFGIIIFIMRILPGNSYFNFPDELNTYETTKLIEEHGDNNIYPHFDISKYYPAIEFITLFLKLFTNLDIFVTAKILIGILHSFILIFVYLFFKSVSNDDNIAVIGSLIYAINPLYIFFHALFVYESLGIFLGILIMYLFSIVINKNKIKNWQFNLIMIITLPVLVISHHLSSIVILSFLFLFLIVFIFYKLYNQILLKISDKIPNDIFHKTLNMLSLTFILIFGWIIYYARPTANYLLTHFVNRFNKIFEINIFGGSKTTISTSLDVAMLPRYESIIDKEIYVPLLLLLSIIGIYCYYKYYQKNLYISTLVIFGPILYIATLGFIFTSGQELAIRLWGFLYIGISLMIAICVNRLLVNKKENNISKNKIIIIFVYLSIILILIGGISIGNKPIHRIPSLLSPKLVAGAGSMTIDVFNSASWFENHLGRYHNMTGDITTTMIFSRYGGQSAYSAWQAFFPEIIDKESLYYLNNFKLNYIIVDKRITISLAEYGMYFSGNELDSPYKKYEYGIIQPLPKKNIEKFDNSDILYKIYDNGNIGIYGVYNRLKEALLQ